MKNPEVEFKKSIQKCKDLKKETGEDYNVINDQFFSVVKNYYFNKERPYHSLYSTMRKEKEEK